MDGRGTKAAPVSLPGQEHHAQTGSNLVRFRVVVNPVFQKNLHLDPVKNLYPVSDQITNSRAPTCFKKKLFQF